MASLGFLLLPLLAFIVLSLSCHGNAENSHHAQRVVNVDDYGAYGDGATDDRKVI